MLVDHPAEVNRNISFSYTAAVSAPSSPASSAPAVPPTWPASSCNGRYHGPYPRPRLVEAWNGPEGARQSRIVPHGQRWFPAAHYANNGRAWQALMALSQKPRQRLLQRLPPVRHGGSYEEAWQIRTVPPWGGTGSLLAG